jgi:squalene-associated FAD-dependent desaturase
VAEWRARRRQGKTPRHIAVVGGGWAGCAAAVELARAGCKVTLFEQARTLGGRARQVEAGGRLLDNGQHILLGAYRDTLALLNRVGVRRRDAFLDLPLQMRYPDTVQGMDFVAPRWPAPFHVLTALLRAKGLALADKMALARFSTTARWMGWQLDQDCTVAELLDRFDQTEKLVRLMWRPLCLAALNTAPEQASAQVFLNVLRDSLGASRAASDMLLPRPDLSALFPHAAARWLEQRHGSVRLGAKVESITPLGSQWQVRASGHSVGGQWSALVDGVVLAVPPPAACNLLDGLGLDEVRARLDAFRYEPITTCYLQYGPELRLPLPFYALVDDPAAAAWGQFVFDRGQLDAGQPGLLAVVVSASGAAIAQGREALARAVAAQLASSLPMPALAEPHSALVMTEKRATFACVPGLVRPANATGLPGLVLAGDYTTGDYPATLEGAVRSGRAAARLLARP